MQAGMHVRDFYFPCNASIKTLCSINTNIITVTEPRLCKPLLPSCVNHHRNDGGFTTACVLCTICAESINITSIQGIKYISGLTWKPF